VCREIGCTFVPLKIVMVMFVDDNCFTGNHSSTERFCKQFRNEYLIWGAISEHTSREQKHAICSTGFTKMMGRKDRSATSSRVIVNDIKNDLLTRQVETCNRFIE
jgi:3-deoxy-D-arabino-heptulosonate 7-phosphate (DAHP) synthase